MSSALHCHRIHFGGSSPLSPSKAPRRGVPRRLAASSAIRCYQVSEEEKTHRVTLKNGGDSLEICRVLNGMWQTSGGWGRIDRDDAVEAMFRYADAGLSTFDMADHCATSVKYGKDSLDICRVVNGMWQTSGGWGSIDRDSVVDAMIRYADAGLNTFDMADIYGPAEDLYGIFINRVRRERPPEYLETIRGLTKWVPPPVKMTSSFVRDAINVSRKRMDVASLDMLQFHWWDYSNPGYLDALKHITDLKEEGKIKMVALTNFDTERLQIILENDIPVVSNQVQHSIVDMRPQQKMAELCQLTGVKLITYGTVMGGLLSEKFLDTNIAIPFAGPPLNTPSLQKYKRMVDAWGGWSQFQVLLQTLKTIASKHGVTIPTVAVKYVLDQPAVAGSMVGVRLGLAEHIKDTNDVFSLVLDEDDVANIREVSKRGRDLLKVIGDCGDDSSLSTKTSKLGPSPVPDPLSIALMLLEHANSAGSSAETFLRQSGQLECFSSQWSIQSMWNACLHLGNNLRISTSSNLERHTAHSRPCLSPLRDENRKKGRDSITVLSIPENRVDRDRARIVGFSGSPLPPPLPPDDRSRWQNFA